MRFRLAIVRAKAPESADEKILHILGGTGSRLDHVLANLQMLKNIMEAGVQGILIDKNNQDSDDSERL